MKSEKTFHQKEIKENSPNFYVKYLLSLKQTNNNKVELDNKVNLNDSFSTCTSTNSTKHEKKESECSLNNYLDKNYPFLASLLSTYSAPNKKISIKQNGIFIIVKSFNIENIHKALKYNVWSTTFSGIKLFDEAYARAQKNNTEVYLVFGTNSMFSFQGIAKMNSFYQNKSFYFWKGNENYKRFNGSFKIEWVIVKDIPFSTLDSILVDKTPLSRLRNGCELDRKTANEVVSIFENFYFCSSLVTYDFKRLDDLEKQNDISV